MTGPFIIDLEGFELTPEEKDRLKHPWVGGVILFTRNFQDVTQLKALTSALHALRPSNPLLISVDHEGGRIQRFREGFTKLPSFSSLGERLPPCQTQPARQAPRHPTALHLSLPCQRPEPQAPTLPLN